MQHPSPPTFELSPRVKSIFDSLFKKLLHFRPDERGLNRGCDYKHGGSLLTLSALLPIEKELTNIKF